MLIAFDKVGIHVVGSIKTHCHLLPSYSVPFGWTLAIFFHFVEFTWSCYLFLSVSSTQLWCDCACHKLLMVTFHFSRLSIKRFEPDERYRRIYPGSIPNRFTSVMEWCNTNGWSRSKYMYIGCLCKWGKKRSRIQVVLFSVILLVFSLWPKMSSFAKNSTMSRVLGKLVKTSHAANLTCPCLAVSFHFNRKYFDNSIWIESQLVRAHWPWPLFAKSYCARWNVMTSRMHFMHKHQKKAN